MPAGVHLKEQKNMRLSPEARAILRYSADYWGLSETAVVEKMLREEAHRKGWNVKELMHRFS